jgi:hypothetical protein
MRRLCYLHVLMRIFKAVSGASFVILNIFLPPRHTMSCVCQWDVVNIYSTVTSVFFHCLRKLTTSSRTVLCGIYYRRTGEPPKTSTSSYGIMQGETLEPRVQFGSANALKLKDERGLPLLEIVPSQFFTT